MQQKTVSNKFYIVHKDKRQKKLAVAEIEIVYELKKKCRKKHLCEVKTKHKVDIFIIN